MTFFHVSQLKKYHPDPTHVIDYEEIRVQENLSFTVEPEKILDRRMKQLRNKAIPLVKVVWKGMNGEETT